MADEQGGEQIGRLWTEIGGDLGPLDEALAQGQKRLENFIAREYSAKIGVQFEESGGAAPRGLVDRTGKQIGAAAGQAAVGSIETSLRGKTIKDVKVETKPKVDKDTLIAGIQGALNGHAFKLTLDIEHLRTQIQGAFGNVVVSSAAGGGGGGAPTAGIISAFREEFDKRLNDLRLSDSGKEKRSLGSVVEDLARELRELQGAARGGTGPTSALTDIIDDLGED